ncbi:MAG: hypothetical protein D6753_06870 [Planctomycetota bacterium]|nr:MAG: hypothetical protein D6753_06870 [Planctomycetota bacterium]
MARAVSLILVFILAAPALGQPRRGGPRNRYLGEALRELDRHHPERELMELLWHPPVRQEIGLTDEEFAHVMAEMRGVMVKIRDLDQSLDEKEASREEVAKKLAEIVAPAYQRATEYLKENADFERLVELFVQQRGYSAASNQEVAKRIGLEGEALKEFQEAKHHLLHEMMDKVRPEFERLIRTPKGSQQEMGREVERLFKHAHQEVDEKLAQRLTPEQKAALDRMRDRAPFADLPRPGMGPMRGRGPREGRGPERGRPGPPGPPPSPNDDGDGHRDPPKC